jgi:hypothetical protein
MLSEQHPFTGEGNRRTDSTQPTESCLRLTGRGVRATIV